jgi:MFS family permease
VSRRDLRLFYLFRMLATSYLWAPIFLFFQQSRGLGFRELMFLGGLYSLVVLLVEIPTGALADRFGRKVSMQLGALAMTASGLWAYFFAHDLPTFMVSETLAALSLSLSSGADSAYLFDLLAAEGAAHEYGKRESTASAWHQAGTALAYAGGGALAMVDLALPYLVTAGVGVLAFGAASMLHERQSQTFSMKIATVPHAAWHGWVRLMRRALSELVHNGRLAWLIAYSAVVFTLLRAAQYLYQPYLKSYGLDYGEIGLVQASVYVAASLVAHQAYRLRRWIGDERLLWGLLGSLAVSFVVMAPIHGPVILVLLAVQAAANGLCSPLVKPLLNREISDSSRRATILSVESIARRGLTGLFIPIAGLWNQSAALTISGILGLAGLAILAGIALHSPHLRAEPAVDRGLIDPRGQ